MSRLLSLLPCNFRASPLLLSFPIWSIDGLLHKVARLLQDSSKLPKMQNRNQPAFWMLIPKIDTASFVPQFYWLTHHHKSSQIQWGRECIIVWHVCQIVFTVLSLAFKTHTPPACKICSPPPELPKSISSEALCSGLKPGSCHPYWVQMWATLFG